MLFCVGLIEFSRKRLVSDDVISCGVEWLSDPEYTTPARRTSILSDASEQDFVTSSWSCVLLVTSLDESSGAEAETGSRGIRVMVGMMSLAALDAGRD